MRSFVISMFVLAAALAPAAAMAQTPAGQPPQQPPAQGTTAQPPAQGTQPPATPPAGQQAPASGQQAGPAPRMFTSDAGMIFNQIKPDHTADFEMVIGRLKDALAKSPDPKRRQQAAGWKVFKAMEGTGGNTLYIFWMDPAVKDADYTVSKILAESFPSEVQDLWKKYVDAYAGGQNMVNLQLIANLAGAPAAGGK